MTEAAAQLADHSDSWPSNDYTIPWVLRSLQGIETKGVPPDPTLLYL